MPLVQHGFTPGVELSEKENFEDNQDVGRSVALSPAAVAPRLTDLELDRLSYHSQHNNRATLNTPSRPYARRHRLQRNLRGANHHRSVPQLQAPPCQTPPFSQTALRSSSRNSVALPPNCLVHPLLPSYPWTIIGFRR